MPIYEYLCRSCEKEFSELIRKPEEEVSLQCPRCQGQDLKRLISRVQFHLTESQRLEQYDPKAKPTDSFYRDSRNIGLSAKKRAQELGADLGSGFEEKLEKARSNPAKFINEKD
ncbi:MAG: zinc ribbon domain-containing protein [Proteobacteria bacterium]|nr:zinc ribbon domain-containing protein [Pseudomonadota bacterium]